MPPPARACSSVVGRFVDERPDEHAGAARVAHAEGREDRLEPGHELVGNALVNDQPAEGGAALACGSGGGEGDGAGGQFEIGRRGDDHAVVAAELEQATAQAFTDHFGDGPAHGDGAGRRHKGHMLMCGDRLASVAAADDDVAQRQPLALVIVFDGALNDGMDREPAEGRFFAGLPDDGVTADEGEHGVPGPDGHGEVEGGDDADHAQRVPLFHHAVRRTLAGDRQSVELSRQPDGEIAHVDPFLHFALGFGGDLAGFEGDEVGKLVLVLADALPNPADQFAPQRRRNDPPGVEGLARRRDRAGDVAAVGLAKREQGAPVDGAGLGEPRALAL